MSSAMRVDLNCDVGEGAPHDEALLSLATSANIACGAHAGDAATMRHTVALAAARGVAIGAHPGYADRDGMGRRELGLPAEEVAVLVTDQVDALAALARAAGSPLRHVKLHGALYNRAARAAPIADAAAQAVARLDRTLAWVGLPGTEHERAAARAGLHFAAEAFADRGYAPDGHLTARGEPGAFIHDPEQAARRMIALLRDGSIETVAGTPIAMRADTICIHGDDPAALVFAREFVARLRAAGVDLRPLEAPAGR
jgi:5-oxoprolinase (ATP-hydrolysing) subunit A